ncbi:MAG: DUF6062 family protein [Oscillospiraceae bacterium]|nr:DUF6062 family protein [Oscillospiraceae bacterium]
MRESLLTIPVNEVFEPKEGCPICRMRDTVEGHICEYIMGAAMMEPDVREETNRLGFCTVHYPMLAKQGNRLSLALMLNSHLATTRKKIFDGAVLTKSAKAKRAETLTNTCFVCTKVDWGINHMLKTVFTLFEKERVFRELFKAQEFFCLPHYHMLATKSEVMPKAQRAEFLKALNTVVSDYAKQLNINVGDFCDSFDYRNAGKLHSPEMEHVRTSPQTAVRFLTGREMTNN